MNIQFDEKTSKLIAEQKTVDEQDLKEKWDKLKLSLDEEFGNDKSGEMIAALKELCATFTPDMVAWMANLYDHQIGGFYYSDSGRDNEGFLPDVESTAQAIGMLRCLGFCGEESTENLQAALPDWFKKRMIAFVKGLQAPNGFFYHPQWGVEKTDANEPRRGRDVGMAVNALTFLGGRPTYNTPSGVKGDGILADGRPAPDFVSSNVEKQEHSTAITFDIPDHLTSPEKFVEYIEKLSAEYSPYYVGNALESQATQILASEKLQKENGADFSLTAIFKEWFDARQNPNTGLWRKDDKVEYDDINGFLKIGNAYHRMKLPIPHVSEALDSITKSLYFDNPYTVCYFLNPWYAVTTIMMNVSKFGTNCEAIARFKDLIAEKFPELVRITIKNMMLFKRPDGSFGMVQNRTVATSQGMPVALEGTWDGDVNAVSCTKGVIGHIFASIGHYGEIPLYGKADLIKFMYIIEKNAKGAL